MRAAQSNSQFRSSQAAKSGTAACTSLGRVFPQEARTDVPPKTPSVRAPIPIRGLTVRDLRVLLAIHKAELCKHSLSYRRLAKQCGLKHMTQAHRSVEKLVRAGALCKSNTGIDIVFSFAHLVGQQSGEAEISEGIAA